MNKLFQSVVLTCAIILCTNIISTYGIINGRDPKLNEVKYEVLVLGGGLCSGGIIGDKHILTAAHCIKTGPNNTLKQTRVVAATNSSSYDPNKSILKYVKRAFVLSAYAKKKPLHDIAVLELSGSIRIEKNSDRLQKLVLPTPISTNPLKYKDYIGTEFKGAGFGSKKVKFITETNGKIRSKTSGGGSLQVAKAIVLENRSCTKVYGGKLENRMCYAIIEDPEKKTFQGFCAGDSGTPIVVDDNVVIGVHTAGGNCNTNINPDMAIKTTAFLPFIQNAMDGVVTADMQVYNAW